MQNFEIKVFDSLELFVSMQVSRELAGILAVIQEFLMKSFVAKKENVEHDWFVVDASEQILGRLASKIALILMGKNKPTYTAHVDTGDYVIVLNASKIKVSGKKAEVKEYDHYTFYPGGHRYVSFADMLERRPERVIELAVRRMLPKNKIGVAMLKKLKIYGGSEHEHQAQCPKVLEMN